ncbi:hypothetical protein ABPG73_004484 [Tetrahymena malaccensis]
MDNVAFITLQPNNINAEIYQVMNAQVLANISANQAQCWNIISVQICLNSDQNQCVDYSKETDSSSYVGLMKSSDFSKGYYLCAEINKSVASINAVILKPNYCIDPTTQIINSLLLQNNYVGIDTANYYCLKVNQTATATPICKQGQQINQAESQFNSGHSLFKLIFIIRYCILSNACIQLSPSYPQKLQSGFCSQLGVAISIECFQDSPFTNKSICMDSQNKICSQIQDLSWFNIVLFYCIDIQLDQLHYFNYQQGIQPNGTCVQQQKVYDNIVLCSDQSCILKNISGFSCIPFDNVYIGIDNQGYCLQMNEPQAIRCRNGKFCIEQINISCVQLSSVLTDFRIARETNTTNCLAYSDFDGQNIEICADGYCLYTQYPGSPLTDYCIQYGSTFQSDLQPFIGVESITERCLHADQYVNCKLIKISIFSLCILLFIYQKQLCFAMGLNFAFQMLTNSVSCAEPLLCLYNGLCISLNDQNNSFVGRDQNTQMCIGDKTYYAQYCKQDYCIFQNKCVHLSSQFIGSEYFTSKCLTVGQTTKKKIQQCIDGYCISQKQNTYQCIQLDIDMSKNAVGVDKNGHCLGINQPVAVKCFKDMSCTNITLQGQVCVNVDPSGLYKCSNADGSCQMNSSSCSSCNFSQCLNLTNYQTQTGICSPIGSYCQDSQGLCASISSGKCNVCPQNFCIDNIRHICIPFEDMQIEKNQCVKQVRPDLPCIIVDLNQQSMDTNIQCASLQNECVFQSTANPLFQCKKCSQNFLNVGDDRCLTFKERDKNNQQQINTIFQLNLIYIVEDSCSGKICLTNNWKKCPIGCYSCKDLNQCTKCVEGYFLFQSSDKSVQCIKCNYLYNNVTTYPYTYRIPEGTIQVSQKCLDCNLEQGLWNNNQILSKICEQVVLKFQIDQASSLLFIENLPPQTMAYQIQNRNNPNTLQFPQYNLVPTQQCTQNNCQSCTTQLKNGAYTQVCQKCIQGFYLDLQQQCQSCNSTCLQCELGTLDIYGAKIYYYELPSGQRQNLAVSQLYPLCQICKNNSFISYDLISCDQCGKDCTTCQYTNGFNFYNIGIQNNVLLSQSEYKSLQIFKQCLTCKNPSNTIQPNGSFFLHKINTYFIIKIQLKGSDCGQSIFNCQLHTLINKKTNQIDLIYNFAYYQNGSTSDSALICVNCQDKYILSPDKQICTKNGNILDNSCLKFDSDNKSCQLCQTFALDLKNKVCDSKIKCTSAVSGCSQCFYQNVTQSSNSITDLLFTCVQCQQDNYMPTLLGCVKCFDGCSKCYEIGYDNQQRKFNITADIIYGSTTYDTDTRLNYKAILKAQSFCISCLQGYYFDPILKICTLLPCGQFCANCVFQINKFYCLQCNQTAVLLQLSQISLFLGEFYFGQNFLPQDIQISTLSADQGSCQICPYLCETCDQSSNIFDNTYSIYQTQCFSCKDITQLSTASKNILTDFQDYEIRYDKERFRCTLCKIGDQSCYFKKVTTIYAVCLDSKNNIGKGTYDDPLNINMITEINNFDQIIIGESNFDLAIVGLNEIALKELELQIIFPSKNSVCQTQKPIIIKSNLQNQIKSLEIFHLNISYQQVDNQQFYFLQTCPTIIYGFTNVTISNINIDSYSSYFDQFKIGFNIYSTPLNQVSLNNVKFSRGVQGPQNVLLLQLNDLKNNLILKNVTFNNLLYNNTQVIQLQYTQTQINPNLQIQLESVIISNVFFIASNFIQMTQNNTVLNMNYCSIISCQLDYSSILFQQLTISQKFTQQLSVQNLNLKNNQILNYSIIFLGNQFTNVAFSNIFISNNILFLKTQSLGQSPSLFQLNCLKANFISIYNNTINQYVIINSLKQANSLSNQINLVGVQFYQNNVTNNEFIFFIDSGQIISQFFILATKIYNNQIISNPQNISQTLSFICLSYVKALAIQDTELNNSSEIQFLKILQANNLKINGFKSIQSQQKNNNNQILDIQCLYDSMVIKNIYFQNLIFQKSLISVILYQSTNPFQSASKILLIQDFQIINCIANITQIQFSNAPIQITSQVQETIVIYNFLVSGSQLLYSIKANEVPSKIASCAYLEALIGNIEINNSKFYNNYSKQKNNCLVVNAQQLIVNNSIFINDLDSGIDFSNTTVLGGFLMSSVQSLYIKDSNFQGGRAKQGGALYLIFNSIGFLKIQDSSFVNNMSFNQFDNENNGGAIYIDTQLCNFSAQIYTVSFIQNVAFYQGGAIFVLNSQYKKVFNIADTQFIDNFSQKGTVLYFDFNQNQKNIFFLKNCITSYNRINISQNVLIKFVRKLLKQQSFQNLYFLRGFYEITFSQNQFMMDETQVNQIQQNYFALNNFFYVENVYSFIDLSNQYQDITYNDSLIKFIGVEQINIQSSQFTRIISQQAANFIQMNSFFIQIYGAQFNNNQCLNCNKGLLQLMANYIIILNSQFEQNSILDKGALYLQQTQNNNLNSQFRNLQIISDQNYRILLIDLMFKNNYSQFSGGAVYVDTSSATFQNCTFTNNKAIQGNGGAIYYNGIEKITNLKVKYSIFKFNVAQIGGAIYSYSGQAVQNLYTQNVFQNNLAQKFSSNVYKYPYRLILINNQTQLNNNYISHVSGRINDQLSLQFMTEDNEYFKEFPEKITLNIKLNDTINANINVQQITQQDGNFKLNMITLNGIFGATVKLTFSSELIKYPEYDANTGEISKYNSIFNSLELVVQFVYNCELGYYHYKTQNYDFCQRCNNPYYNTYPGQSCIKCPDYGAICDGGMIYFKQGYWRKNLNSTDTYQCNSQVNSCIGDIDIYESKGLITRNPEIRYCKAGFVGPLCSDCDVYGVYWNDSYVQNANQNCTNKTQF